VGQWGGDGRQVGGTLVGGWAGKAHNGCSPTACALQPQVPDASLSLPRCPRAPSSHLLVAMSSEGTRSNDNVQNVIRVNFLAPQII
jgi:hypothetical protein